MRIVGPKVESQRVLHSGAQRPAGKAMIAIHEELLLQICVNAEQSYPNECCGLLLGTSNYIKEIWAVENVSKSLRHRRYLIHPEDFLRAESHVRGREMEVIGVYHSHPDHPARPSLFDRENAIPHYLYLIVNVSQGRAGDLTCWRIAGWDSDFGPEELQILK